MNVPIVISTGRGRGPWVSDCLLSIGRGNLTVCHSDLGGELGAIRMVYEGTHWKRFLLLQDSVQVLDNELFDVVDAVNGPCLLAPHPAMYLAVYERSVLDVVGIPVIHDGDREKAIQHEVGWMVDYQAECHRQGFECPVLFPDFRDASSGRTEERHGRLNLVIENRYLRKLKGTWR